MDDQKHLINLLRHELQSKFDNHKLTQEKFDTDTIIIDTLEECLTQNKKNGIQDLINNLESEHKENINLYLNNYDKTVPKNEKQSPIELKNYAPLKMDAPKEIFDINLITNPLEKLNKDVVSIKNNIENDVKKICDKLINVITLDLIHPLKESYNQITETIQENLKSSEKFSTDLITKIENKLNKLESIQTLTPPSNKTSNFIIMIITILLTSFLSAFIATKYLSNINNIEVDKSKKFDLIINRINSLPAKEKSYIMEQLRIK